MAFQKALLLLAASIAMPAIAKGAESETHRLVITKDWVVRLPPAPHRALSRAAKDLQAFLSSRYSIAVGITQSATRRVVDLKVNPLRDRDGFLLKADPADETILVEAGSPRATYQGVLFLEDCLAQEASVPPTFQKAVTFPFRDRYVLWDSLLTGQNKGAIGFDLERHVREAVRLGYSGMECNRFIGMTLIQQGDPRDPYPWYTYWGPSMDQFVSSPLFDGVFPKDYLARNLADLKHVVDVVESHGLKPIFMGYEPRFVPEEFLARHPALRGPRVDHPLRSIVPRYSLCVDQPEVLNHYRTLARRLAQEVPGLREMHVIPQDSGAGVCWGDGLYAGRNGPDRCKDIPAGARMREFFSAIKQGLAEGGLDIPLVVQPHKMSRPEIDDFFATVPKEIEFSAGNWASWSLSFRDPLDIDRHVLARQSETGRRRLIYQQHFFGFDGAPTSEFPIPFMLAERLQRAKELNLDALNTLGGFVSPPVKDQSAMQEVYRRFLIQPDLTTEDLVGRVAVDLGGEDGAGVLLQAWKEIHDVIEKNGRSIGFAMGTEYASRRTLVRPLVPEASALSAGEADWWLSYTFGGYLRFGRSHLFRSEGGLPAQEWYRRSSEQVARSSEAFRKASGLVLAFLKDQPRARRDHPYLTSHERQLRFLSHVYATGANLYEGQRLLDKYSAKGVEPGLLGEVDADLARFRSIVVAEMENTRAFRDFVGEGGDIGMILLPEETTWGYSANLPDLLGRKIEIMKTHLPEAEKVLKRWFGSEY